MKLKKTLVYSSILLSTTLVSQNWQVGGNPLTPIPFAVTPTNNFLGSDATNSTWIKLGVQAQQDIFIDNDNTKLYPNSTVNGYPQGGHWVGLGRIFKPTTGPGNNPVYAPKAHLHIHGRNDSQYSGFSGFTRPWFDTGVLLTEESDGLYIGLKRNGLNQSNAIINWSDDTGANAPTDFLQFNFTGYADLGGTVDGAELARMSPEKGKGTLGVGNFQFIGASTQPVRRVEILDADPQTGANTNTPQLRTTYTYNATPTSGIFTEFQTTSSGDMYLNTRANGNARRFGFHDNTPGNTIEITASGSSPIPVGVNGTSGLRFTDMTSANTPQTNPGAGVLSVNSSGDVIYVPSNGIATVNNGLIINAATGAVQLGGACGNLGEIIASALTSDRVILQNNKNFWFADGNNTTSGFGVGGQPTPTPFCGTGNTFEVSANMKNPQYGNTNASGMRFTKLVSSSPTIPNGTNGVNSAKVLTVDGDGDVVLTDAAANVIADNGISVNSGVVQLGVPCTVGGAPNLAGIAASGLTTDRVVPNRNQNLWFASLNAETGGVGVGGHPTGLGFCNVGNTFEVSANSKNPQYGSTNASGMRFTKLLSSSPTIPNGTNGVNSAKVLTVDGDGDVVLTDASTGNFGASCSQPIASSNLTSDWRIGMNNKSVNFVGIGNVNIGDIQGCVPGSSSPARLWVRNSSGAPNPTTGFRVDNNYFANTYAAEFGGNVFINGAGASPGAGLIFSDKTIKKNITTITKSLDIISQIKASSFELDNSTVPQLNVDNTKTYGFIAQNIETVIPELVKDVVIPASFDSLGNETNPSVTLKSLNYDGLIPFAIVGIQELNAKQKEMQANLDRNGLSDAQVKTNVNTFNALATIKTLHPVKYNFTNANVPQLTFKPNTDYGFVAQQLETVYPELVDTMRVDATYDSTGVVINPSKVLKTVNYKAMSALLVRSVQEQQQTIDSLRSMQNAILQQLSALASQINSCCSNTNAARQSNSSINQLDIELSDKDAIILNQNVPNPFAEQTTITYNVPASVGKAQLIFFNTNGQVIQTVDIKTRGKGKVNVFASDLSSGLYNYSLVADGKVIDSKKMVRE